MDLMPNVMPKKLLTPGNVCNLLHTQHYICFSRTDVNDNHYSYVRNSLYPQVIACSGMIRIPT